MASSGDIADGTASWSCLLSVWPAGNCDDRDARARAMDYAEPADLDVSVGETVSNSPGDDDGDGFNERLGCYVLAPDADLLRFELGGSGRSVHSCCGRL